GGDAKHSVVLGDSFAAGRCSGLELSATGGDGEVGDEGVGGLSGAVGDHLRVDGLAADGEGVESFGDGADLVDLDQGGVADVLADGVADDGGVGDEDVVADELGPVAEPGGQ